MGKHEDVKSVCGFCNACCGVLITLEEGRPAGIKGDPDSPPSRGGLCKIGRAALEYLYHPNRLKHPLKRVGERGEGKWQEITWDEALSLTADALNKAKQGSGPEAVVMAHGSAKSPIDTQLVRLANAFGTPNVVCSDHVCWIPKMLALEFTLGFLPSAEYGHPPACVIVWGANMAASRSCIYRNFFQAAGKGMKVIAVDPLETGIAKAAELWLQVRPGSDLALALGMLHVVINEGLYDVDFVERWTSGFERLKSHVQAYPPDWVARITWVPEDLIVKAARLYATSKPSHVEWGNALDHGPNSFQACRAIAILMAITGNVGVPGGEVEAQGSGFRESDPNSKSAQIGIHGRWSAEIELRHKLTKEERSKNVDANLLPDFRYATPQSVVRAILDEEPYRIRAMLVLASNPLSSWPNTRRTLQALKKLDFLAVSDMFMTPTAAMADIVYPAATQLEYDGVQMNPIGTVAQMQRKVAQIGECRSDHEIINGLAKKLGLGEYFWDSIDNFWDAVLQPAGFTFAEFKKMNVYAGPGKAKEYKQYEKSGFRTPSGKVEIYCQELEQLGFEPLPTYHEHPEIPESDPALAKEYPLLCTTRKLEGYRHSGGRQIPSLRALHPDPVVIIHPDTAARLGIKDGDWVYVETSRGRIKQKAAVLTGVDPRVIIADYAWWFPERDEADLFGFADSGYNVLTNDTPPFNKEVGSFNIRGLACKVSKASEP
jgi:anaerobic selenocysteine-containing dehydrogenase